MARPSHGTPWAPSSAPAAAIGGQPSCTIPCKYCHQWISSEYLHWHDIGTPFVLPTGRQQTLDEFLWHPVWGHRWGTWWRGTFWQFTCNSCWLREAVQHETDTFQERLEEILDEYLENRSSDDRGLDRDAWFRGLAGFPTTFITGELPPVRRDIYYAALNRYRNGSTEVATQTPRYRNGRTEVATQTPPEVVGRKAPPPRPH